MKEGFEFVHKDKEGKTVGVFDRKANFRIF